MPILLLMVKKFYIETYGCSANQSHSEVMASSLAANGLRPVEDAKESDVIIINTCIVKTPTENKIRERIKCLISRHPHKKLVIAGCAADVGMFRDIAPGAPFLSSHSSKEIACLLCSSAEKGGQRIRRNPLIGITEISSGCRGNCAYCIVKRARGDLSSRSVEDITREIRSSLNQGCKEIWVTSQDCGCYGLDRGTNLAELLEKISDTEGDFRVRVGMMNPEHVKPILKSLIESYKDPRIYKFLHLPVQSGSDRILEKMRRGYRVKDFEGIVDAFREEFPEITLSTDIIAGFPGETKTDFEASVDLIRRVEPDVVNVSKFGARPGTEAKKMEKVDGKVIKERSKRIARVVKKVCSGKSRGWVSRGCEILVSERGKLRNQFMGRNDSYRPVVVESGRDLLGERVRVGITKSFPTHLFGKIIQS